MDPLAVLGISRALLMSQWWLLVHLGPRESSTAVSLLRRSTRRLTSADCSLIHHTIWIEAFGGAEVVGEAIMGTITGRSRGYEVKGTLISPSLRQDSMMEGVKFYELEFEVESPTFHPHNFAVCCVRKGRLFTLNVRSPESVWPQFRSHFYTIAALSI